MSQTSWPRSVLIWQRLCVLCLTSPLLLVSPASGEAVDFRKEVLPILAGCFDCHGEKQHYSNLRLDSRSAILRGGELGEVVVPGEPDTSPLYLRASLPADDLDFMPVDGDPLTSQELEILRRWIETGAEFGDWTEVDE